MSAITRGRRPLVRNNDGAVMSPHRCDHYIAPHTCLSQNDTLRCDHCARIAEVFEDPAPVDRADVTRPRQGYRSGDDVDERWQSQRADR